MTGMIFSRIPQWMVNARVQPQLLHVETILVADGKWVWKYGGENMAAPNLMVAKNKIIDYPMVSPHNWQI